MSDKLELSKGDYVYQSDQELFLVMTGETENSYQFAVHGWREIGKDRLDEYISHENGKLYQQTDIEELVEEEGDDSEKESFVKMLEMFNAYSDADLDEEGPHTEFALEDT
jgi:hypothetical protein